MICFNEDTSIHESVQVLEDLKSMTEQNIIDSAKDASAAKDIIQTITFLNYTNVSASCKTR